MKVLFFRFFKLTPVFLLSLTLSCGGGGGGSPLPTNPIASIVVKPETVTLAKGGSVELSASARDVGGNVISGVSFTWSSNDENVAQVTSAGLVKGKSAGRVTITASSGGISGNATLEVKTIASIVISPSSANLARTGVLQFTATAKDTAGTTLSGAAFTYSSDHPGTVGVDANGLASGLSVGTATLIVSAEEIVSTAVVEVKTISTITLSPSAATLPKNSFLQFSAVARAADATELVGAIYTWSSDASNIAAIDSNGLASGTAKGATTINASADGVSGHATVDVTDPLFFSPASYGAGDTPESLAVGDFDGDGTQDLAVVNVGITPGSLSILKGAPDGSFTQPNRPLPTGKSPFSVVAGRFDANTIEDLAVANYEAETPSQDMLSIFLGSPSGPSAVSPAVLDFNNGPISLAVADFDGDSGNDIAIANFISDTITVIRGNGNGTFGAPGGAIAVAGGPVAILAAQLDSDNDTDVDLAVVLVSAGKIALLFGNGDRTFSSPQMINVGTNPNAVAAGDWNGDGKTDLAVVNSGSRNITLLFGDGTGAFPSPQTIPLPGAANPSYIVTGDFDGISFLDLAVSDQGNNSILILLNNGGGTFSDPVSLSNVQHPLAMAVGRFNADNLDDLAVVNSTGTGTVSVFLQFP